jgi:hypothetical protein
LVSKTEPKRIGTGLAGPGRPKGVVPKATREVRDAARALVDDQDYRAALRVRLKAGTAPHMETLLWHYGYGKPTERIEVKDTTNEFEDLTAEQLRERARLIAHRIIDQPQQDDPSVH